MKTFLLQTTAAYVASIARVLSWMIVAAMVYRLGGERELALLMLLRGTVGLLSYASVAIVPQLVHTLSRPVAAQALVEGGAGIDYAPVATEAEQTAPRRVFATAFFVVLMACCAALVPLFLYASHLTWFHQLVARAGLQSDPVFVALWLGVGVLARVLSEVFGARLQARGRLVADSVCVCASEAGFVVLTLLLMSNSHEAQSASLAFMAGSLLLLALRRAVQLESIPLSLRDFNPKLVPAFVAGGALVLISQVADWLYAPLNQILIDQFLDPRLIADYVPAIQVDAALLLLVAGLSTVLLPRTALAFHAGDVGKIRGYYLVGTVFSVGILAMAAWVICLLDHWLFRLWFNDPLPLTQAILPLVMIHTVIGGSASIGRSVLFGMGLFKPYAIAALVGGLANVALAVTFLELTDWGLRGIIYATILTVSLRCAVWMPWYTLHVLRRMKPEDEKQQA